jgi:hypothetical protein
MVRRRWLALLAVSGVMLVVRLAWVERFREIDSDAYGHFLIAIATRRDPWNLAVHWVWLPLYHVLVAGLTVLGLTFHRLRLANAILTTAGPLLLYHGLRERLCERESPAPSWAGDSPLLAAVIFAIAPLPTVLGQSAQPEALFAVPVVAAFAEAARHRSIAAGLALGAACFVRYEAWGAALALVLWWALSPRGSRPPLALVAIPAGLVVAYVLLRWWTDGRLFLFVRGTHDITREQVGREAWTFREIISFPIVLPYYVMGPALILVPVGLRPGLVKIGKEGKAGWVMPAGYAAFLLLSYYAGAAHSGERYLVSLVPFGSIAIAAGVVRIGRRLGRRKAEIFALVTVGVVATTTAWHLRRAARMAIAWDVGLADREHRMNAL